MTLELTIFEKNYSSWSLRPWLLLVKTGAPFREVVLRPSDPDFHRLLRARSPSGKVPVLTDGPVVVWESLAIAEYLAELYPDARLWPEAAAARAHARAISAEMHAGLAELRRQCPMNLARRGPIALDPATRKDVDRFSAIVAETRARFGAGGPYLFGTFSIADAMFAPVVTRAISYELPVGEAARTYVEAMRSDDAMERFYREAAAELTGHAAQVSAVTGPEVEPDVEPRDQVPARACWAVIFQSKLRPSPEGYGDAAARMVELARSQAGFLGIASARGADGFGITVSYWDSLDSIAAFRRVEDHLATQARRRDFYASYEMHVARVERTRRFAG